MSRLDIEDLKQQLKLEDRVQDKLKRIINH